ncbi:MAG TPA: hypothetical protein VMU06_12935 [Stellaceae bacterium]|nr:hypothetical protein [Stellaceae bacterium]
MTAQIIDLAFRREAAREGQELQWERTKRGRAVGDLERAARAICGEDRFPMAFPEDCEFALNLASAAVKALTEILEDNITLEEDFKRLAAWQRKMAAVEKARLTRRRNKAAREQSET